MTTPSNIQKSNSETPTPTNLGNNCSKKEREEQTSPIVMLGKLSASALLIIGVIYVMGYVIVNGYQARYMNYSANALQLRHLTAGVLYVLLTLFQVGLVAFFLLSAVIDVKFPPHAGGQQKATDKGKSGQESWSLIRSILKYSWAIGKSLLFAFVLTVLFLKFVGVSLPPTRLPAILKEILPWVGINLLMSIVIVKGLYSAGSENFERALREATEPAEEDTEQVSLAQGGPKQATPEQPTPEQATPEQATPEQVSPQQTIEENDAATDLKMQQVRRIFIQAQSKPLVAPLVSFILLLFSLIFFQGLYGRLMPDYGGGALYRVTIHFKPPSQVSSPTATPTPMPSANSTPSPVGTSSPDERPASWKEAIKKSNSWVLLVDRDTSFVYVLRVDKEDKKQLLQISSGEIEAVEVLADPPISPADARFFIQ